MLRNLVLLAIFTFSMFLNAWSQNISVKSFRSLPNDMDARQNYPEKDQNGNLCAIIKVATLEKGFYFDIGTLGITKTEQKAGEIWLWIPYGAKRITITHDKFLPLRDYYFPETISEGMCYEMMLTAGKVVTTVLADEVITQWITINSDPPGADVYINDLHKGQTPFQLELETGIYSYRVEKSLYYPEAGRFELVKDKKVTLAPVLKPNFGFIKITSTPESGAIVQINGTKISQTTPLTTDRLRSGKYTVTVSKSMYHSLTKDVIVSDNNTSELGFELKPDFGGINITTTPESGAEVLVDGNSTGKITPCKIDGLSSGQHQITVRKQWYQPKTQLFQVKEGESNDLEIELMPTFGTVNVSAESEAQIFIDDQKKGTGQWDGRLIAGWHTIEAKKEKYYPQQNKLEVKVGEFYQINLLQTPITGVLKVRSTPFDAEIRLNGKHYGTTPITIPDLLIGDYTLQLSKSGYANVVKEINISEKKSTEINETLSSQIKVTVQTTPSGAQVYIDNVLKGTAPISFNTTIGSHDIRISAGPDYAEHKENIMINDDEKSLVFLLKENFIKVNVRTDPADANIYVDEEYKGKSPVLIKVIPGNHYFRISAGTDFIDHDEKLLINEDKKQLNFVLRENPHSPKKLEAFKRKIYTEDDEILEGIFLSGIYQIVYIQETPALITPPVLIKGYTFSKSTIRQHNAFLSFAVLGRLMITPEILTTDLISLGFGYMFVSPDHKNRIKLEIAGGLNMQFATSTKNYLGYEIVREHGLELRDTPASNGDLGKSAWKIVPGDVSLSYERYLGGKSFLCITGGCMWGPDMNWYYKDEYDTFIREGGDSPSPIYASDLPATPFIEGIQPYVGIGIRIK